MQGWLLSCCDPRCYVISVAECFQGPQELSWSTGKLPPSPQLSHFSPNRIISVFLPDRSGWGAKLVPFCLIVTGKITSIMEASVFLPIFLRKILYVCVFACVHVHTATCMHCRQRPEEVLETLKQVTVACELSCECWLLKRPLHDQHLWDFYFMIY